jgi:hypothetical protein
MRWLKHLVWTFLAFALTSGLAVSATDLRHPPAAATPAAEQPAPNLAPELGRFTEEIEGERAALEANASDLQNSSAKITLLLIGCFVVMVLLFGTLIAQVIILYRSVEAVRADKIIRNRPKLIVRQLDLEVFEPGRLGKVLWMVENIGNSSASIIEAHATLTVLRRGGLPAIPEYDTRNHAVGGLTVEAGRVVPFVQFSREDVSSADYDAIFRSGGGGIFFYGYMLYLDDAASRRRLGFCRQYDPSSGRFIVVDDLNYEYAD